MAEAVLAAMEAGNTERFPGMQKPVVGLRTLFHHVESKPLLARLARALMARDIGSPGVLDPSVLRPLSPEEREAIHRQVLDWPARNQIVGLLNLLEVAEDALLKATLAREVVTAVLASDRRDSLPEKALEHLPAEEALSAVFRAYAAPERFFPSLGTFPLALRPAVFAWRREKLSSPNRLWAGQEGLWQDSYDLPEGESLRAEVRAQVLERLSGQTPESRLTDEPLREALQAMAGSEEAEDRVFLGKVLEEVAPELLPVLTWCRQASFLSFALEREALIAAIDTYGGKTLKRAARLQRALKQGRQWGLEGEALLRLLLECVPPADAEEDDNGFAGMKAWIELFRDTGELGVAMAFYRAHLQSVYSTFDWRLLFYGLSPSDKEAVLPDLVSSLRQEGKWTRMSDMDHYLPLDVLREFWIRDSSLMEESGWFPVQSLLRLGGSEAVTAWARGLVATDREFGSIAQAANSGVSNVQQAGVLSEG